jgi:chorismate-pyruvate lyase
MLFRYPQLRRTPFELALIDGRSQLPAALRCDDQLWARRSRFALGTRALVVSETFLPAFQPTRAP